MELIKTKEAAQILGVCPAKMVHMRLKGRGPCFIKVDKRVSYDRAEVLRYLEKCKVNTNQD